MRVARDKSGGDDDKEGWQGTDRRTPLYIVEKVHTALPRCPWSKRRRIGVLLVKKVLHGALSCLLRILLAAVTPKLSAWSHFSLVALLPPSLLCVHLALAHVRRRYPRQGNFSPALPPSSLCLSGFGGAKAANVSFPWITLCI